MTVITGSERRRRWNDADRAQVVARLRSRAL
jgi:hypothetical protein